MTFPSFRCRSFLLGSFATAVALSCAYAEVPSRIVFQNGRWIPVSAVAVQGEQFVVKSSAEGYLAGQAFSVDSADHIYGDKPVAVNRGIALLVLGKPVEAIALLEPVVASEKITAKIPGNFWIEAAQATLVAYALNSDPAKCTAIGKEITDASTGHGTDPFVALGKALLLPMTTKSAERESALKDLTSDSQPTVVRAYAAFFLGDAYKASKKNKEALEAYLTVPCLYPTGEMILNAAAEMNAAEYLTVPNRRPEAVMLLKSSLLQSSDTLVATEANKRLDSLK